MNPMLYAIPVFMASIVIEALIARRRAPGAYDLPDALTSLHFGILSQVWGAFTRVIGFGIYVLAFEHLRVATLPADSVWVWVFALLCYDFCYYWAHRAGHEVNLFWASHQVHHSSEYYNLSTALRQTATGGFTSWPFYIVMAVAGVPPMVFAVVGLIDLLYQYWVHTELVGKLGWLDRVLVTPSNHRVHHGQNDYCIDRNYGGIFSVWDRMFGTYADERSDEKVVYGVRKPLRSWDPVWGNIHHFVTIARSVRDARGWRERLAHVFGPPRGPSQLAAADEPPFRPEAFVPFATPTPRFMRVIGVCSTLAGTAALMAFYRLLPGMSLGQSLLYMATMLAFFSIIGQLWLHPRVTGAARQ